MREPAIDPAIPRAIAFILPGALPGLLAGVAARAARLPAEVYDGDEDSRLTDDDIGPSIFAREIRAVRPRAEGNNWASSPRERAILRRTERLRDHIDDGSLIGDALWLAELPRRERLRNQYGPGRGEAA